MQDQLITCENCGNPFVYSVYEQIANQKANKMTPVYCPICASIKASEQKHPPKPKNNLE